MPLLLTDAPIYDILLNAPSSTVKWKNLRVDCPSLDNVSFVFTLINWEEISIDLSTLVTIKSLDTVSAPCPTPNWRMAQQIKYKQLPRLAILCILKSRGIYPPAIILLV